MQVLAVHSVPCTAADWVEARSAKVFLHDGRIPMYRLSAAYRHCELYETINLAS